MSSPVSVAEEKSSNVIDEHIETAESVTAEEEDDEDYKFTFGKFLAMLAFQMGYMCDIFVVGSTSTVLAAINRDIGPNGHYTWMATSIVICGAVLSPMVGRLSDIFGRRNFLLLGNTLGIIGCANIATAKNINTVIGGGVLMGMASALHQLAWSCMGEVVPKKHRALALSLLQTSIAPASAFGPIIAQAILAKSSWRNVYWIPLGLQVLALVLVFLFYRPINQYIREEGKTSLQQLASLDWFGFFILVAGLLLFLLGLSFGGSFYPWASAGTIAPIVIGFCLLVTLGFYEAYANLTYPMFPPTIFKNIRGFTVILAGVVVLGMLFYSSAVLWPQQVRILYTTNPISLGWYASIMGISGTVFAPICGILFRKIGHARIVLTSIVCGLAIFSALQALVTPESAVLSTVMTACVGALVSSATIVSATMVQLGVPHAYIGVGTAMVITARSIGGSVGTTLYSTILADRVRHYLIMDVANPLAKAGVSSETIPHIIEALQGGHIGALGLSPEIIAITGAGLKQAYAHSFRIVYLITLAFGVMGTICVAFSRNVDDQMTNKVDIKLDEGARIKGRDNTSGGHIIRHPSLNMKENQ